MVDQKKVQEAIKLLLEGIGEDTDREGLKETPERIGRMYEEICGGMDQDAGEHLSKVFSVDNNEMVLEKDITFYSMCEHHLMPFYGKAHVAYIPDGKVVGLSKLARTVDVYARRLQIQERMTAQIADDIMKYLAPQGVMVTPASDVVGEIEHRFVVLDGIQEKLYPPVRSVEIIDKETDQPRCDKEGHETQYDCPLRNDAGHAQARHQYDGDHLQKNAYV